MECEEFEYDCHTFRGMEATTDRKGEFTITLELDESYDGAEIFLALKGERFSHTIDLEESRSPPSGSVNHDISLQQDSPPAPLFTGLACGGAVIAIAFIAALDRKPAPTISRAQQRTTSARNRLVPHLRGEDGELPADPAPDSRSRGRSQRSVRDSGGSLSEEE